ncbi:hypothetical protein GA0070616_2102 [Micromonospora nigra]|uniref:Uncharacterized protein n=1 Tax=Micromonospora nigra TaxID=145857 RepID=A0A1C6RUQ6_9ACTN|nr:hypothetical protein GA0070616_2102 [Micromonospora nigra]
MGRTAYAFRSLGHGRTSIASRQCEMWTFPVLGTPAEREIRTSVAMLTTSHPPL